MPADAILSDRVVERSYLLVRESPLPDVLAEEPIEDTAFLISDQTDPVERTTQTTATYDAFRSNGKASIRKTRFKREITRERRDCDLNAERCKTLLQSMQSYLETLNNRFPGGVNSFAFDDLLKCLKCKNQESAVANEFDEGGKTSRPNERYFTHDYVARDGSGDSLESGITVIKLLDDGMTKGSSSGGGDRTEAVKNPATEKIADGTSPDSASGSSKDTSSEATALFDRANSTDRTPSTHASNSIVDISGNSTIPDDRRWNGDGSTTNDPPPMRKVPSDESVPVITSNVEEHRVAAESKTAKSSVMTLRFTTTSSIIEATRNNTTAPTYEVTATTANSIGSGETSTRNPVDDLTKHENAIVENVTDEPMRQDVTGINGSAVQPPFEGRPSENQSVARANGMWSAKKHAKSKQTIIYVRQNLISLFTSRDRAH